MNFISGTNTSEIYIDPKSCFTNMDVALAALYKQQLTDEFEKIQLKKSSLTKSERDKIIMLYNNMVSKNE